MTTVATRPDEIANAGFSARLPGLSGRLILLTMSFVMLAEILIFVPSSVSFRRSWLGDRLMGAQMIALALTGTPEEARSAALEARLLTGVKGAQAIGVRGRGTRWILAASDHPPEATREVDLRAKSWWSALGGVVRSLLFAPDGVVRIIGPGVPGIAGVEWVELLVDDSALKQAQIAFARTFVLVSLVISAVTGAMLYLALHLMVVRPVRRLSGNIASFAANPEDDGRVIRPSGRRDEIGVAEEALAKMQTALSGELRQKRHLADLGLAVSKINHELRNMLTTAQLLGDRLGEVEDPTTRRIAPRLVRTLARAVEFCGATLAYGRATERPPQRQRVRLYPIIEEQSGLTALADGVDVMVSNGVDDGVVVDADPDQLARVLLNLMRNAVEALSRAKTPDARITISCERSAQAVTIRVADNGPGVPERARDRLFSAFQASSRSGGTGLGLPIAEELVRLHGGTIVLERTKVGASFLVTIPDRTGEGRTSPASGARRATAG